ncbi:MAG TPA: hypothetical protein VF598_07635, partial [Hymenobacter sp.]
VQERAKSKRTWPGFYDISAAWLGKSDFLRLTEDTLTGKHIVPHGRAYFTELLKQIERYYQLEKRRTAES